MTKGVHQALTDFHWLEQDLDQHPTRLYKLVPLHTTLDVYHYTSGYMCGGQFSQESSEYPIHFNRVPELRKQHWTPRKHTPFFGKHNYPGTYPRHWCTEKTPPVRSLTVTWNWRKIFMTSGRKPNCPRNKTWPAYGGRGKGVLYPPTPGPPTPTAGHAPAVTLLHTLPRCCDQGGQQHIRPYLLFPRSHRRLTTRLHGHNLPAEASMETVDPSKSIIFKISSALRQMASHRASLLI